MQLGEKFFQEKGLKHVQLSTADGALEAAPAVSKLDQRRKLSFEIVEFANLVHLLPKHDEALAYACQSVCPES